MRHNPHARRVFAPRESEALTNANRRIHHIPRRPPLGFGYIRHRDRIEIDPVSVQAPASALGFEVTPRRLPARDYLDVRVAVGGALWVKDAEGLRRQVQTHVRG
jgi:hypothetical protein